MGGQNNGEKGRNWEEATVGNQKAWFSVLNVGFNVLFSQNWILFNSERSVARSLRDHAGHFGLPGVGTKKIESRGAAGRLQNFQTHTNLQGVDFIPPLVNLKDHF